MCRRQIERQACNELTGSETQGPGWPLKRNKECVRGGKERKKEGKKMDADCRLGWPMLKRHREHLTSEKGEQLGFGIIHSL